MPRRSRREALVKDWAASVRFLRLAALESGQVLNYAGISNETGISQPTVKGYYQLLEDMPCGRGIGSFARAIVSPARTTLAKQRRTHLAERRSCRCPRPLALADNIIALPWFCL